MRGVDSRGLIDGALKRPWYPEPALGRQAESKGAGIDELFPGSSIIIPEAKRLGKSETQRSAGNFSLNSACSFCVSGLNNSQSQIE